MKAVRRRGERVMMRKTFKYRLAVWLRMGFIFQFSFVNSSPSLLLGREGGVIVPLLLREGLQGEFKFVLLLSIRENDEVIP
jgi:hypothetical protein